MFSIPSDSLVSKSSSFNSWIISSVMSSKSSTLSSSISSLISSSRLNTITSSSSSSSKLYTGAPLISSEISSSKSSLLSFLMFSLISTSRFPSVVYSISSSLIILSFSSNSFTLSSIWSWMLFVSKSSISSLSGSFSIDFLSFFLFSSFWGIDFSACDSLDFLICSFLGFWAFWGSFTLWEPLFCLLFTNSSPIFLNLFIRDFATVFPLFLFLFEVFLALLEPFTFSLTLNSPSRMSFLFEELSLTLVFFSFEFASNLDETSSLDELNLGLLWGFELVFFTFSWFLWVLDLFLFFSSFLIFSLGISVFLSFSLFKFSLIFLLIPLFLGTLGFLSSILIFSIDWKSISSSSSSIRSGISSIEVFSSLEEFLVNSSSNPSKYLLIKSSFSLSFSAFSLISSLMDLIFAKSLSAILSTIPISSSPLSSMKSSLSSSSSSFPRMTVVTGLIFIDSTSLIFFFKSLTLVLTIVDSIFSNNLALAKSLFLYQSVDQIW